MKKQALFWFRRDLRLEDNAGLFHALSENEQVLLLFIFDTDILDLLADRNDPRVTFIYETVAKLKETLQRHGSDLLIRRGKPLEVFQNLLQDKRISTVYANHDYEASARARDSKIFELLKAHGVPFKTYKDQCLFEKNEIMSKAGTSYTVFGPYKRKVLETLKSPSLKSYHCEPYRESYVKVDEPEAMLDLNDIGFIKSTWRFPSSKISNALLKNYERLRDFPAEKNGTSHLGIHLRFGTLSIREAARHAVKYSDVWLSELIWRDFFMQILWHFPYVETQSFRSEYDKISWRKSEKDFSRWCAGLTGYPLVDAGMRELNETGYMHNRARMVTASFLCKYLLIHWS
ncbi:MAG TPA: deoxyribodipyrimidine photo-lyase, partial [Bdellovibrio sp.]|nr:deoxyribodipyrimidine photo-lyase [Bdellovibrio sp.]